ncbi:NfeD family protein [Desmospora activa]|nr:NfeD family protein [Desmospora activa]
MKEKPQGFKKGDKVVMHTCAEAKLDKYHGKIWTCITDEQELPSGERVVGLEGESACFATEFLALVKM